VKGIGGNTQAVIRIRTVQKNAIGEHVESWEDVQTIKGWLDMASGNSGYQTYNAKIQESTHYFICDYVPLDERITAENARMFIKDKMYDILLLDNPMEMGTGSQWEFYLKYTGGQ
jgi:head-tail adaptor